MMIQLQLPDGDPAAVNSDTINYIQPTNDGTLIVSDGGTRLVVQDAYEAIFELFDPEIQAAEPC